MRGVYTKHTINFVSLQGEIFLLATRTLEPTYKAEQVQCQDPKHCARREAFSPRQKGPKEDTVPKSRQQLEQPITCSAESRSVFILLDKAGIYTNQDVVFHLVDLVLWGGVWTPSYH